MRAEGVALEQEACQEKEGETGDLRGLASSMVAGP